MATEGFTFFVPANYVNITVTAVVRGAGGITLGTVTKTSGISASVLPYFTVGATGSTFDTVTTSTDVVSIVSATHGSSGLPAPTTSYTWNFQGVNVSNTGSSYAIPLGQTGPLSSTIRLDSGAGFTTSVVDFGTVGSTPAVAIGPYGNTVDSVTGTEHTMNAIASGTPTPTTTYAWNFKGVTLANVTNSFTPTSGSTGPLVGQFSVVNRHGSKVTQVDFGTVGDIPSILATGTPLEADGSTVGDVLTVNVVAYCTPAPTLGYAWFTDGTVVAGENSNTYTTTEAATTAHCMVTASNRHGTTINQVNFGEIRVAAAAPAFGSPAPSISPAVGQLNDGETARVLNVNPAGTPTPTITYAWTKTTSLATATVGTNSSSYTAQTADVGATIDCLVTLSNGVSPNATQTFTWGAVLPALTAPFFASGPTADAHDIQVGDVATVVGAIGGNPTPTVSYTWSLDGSVIAGATSSTYTTTTTGAELLAGISASNSEGTVTGTADFGSVSVASSFTKNFAPNFALANAQPSESLYDNGGHTANQAVGYIEMPERIWTPGTTIDFCVSANVVDLEGINKVRVSCHGSTAEVSTVTKGSNGVQGYWFAMNLPAGATTGTPKVYAELIPHNGTSRVVEKEFRSLTPTYVDINVGDTTNDDISALLGHASGSTGTDNMVLRLGAGTYYLTQKSLGTVANKWQEVTTNGNVDVTIIPCVDPAVLGRTGGTPALRLDHTIFRGVTFDTKSAQKVKAGRATYVAFQDCNLTDTWWNQSQGGRPYGIFNGGGLSRNELQQLYFDAYSTTVREPAYEVYDCAMNSPVGGGAILYHNTTMNCSFDPQYIQLGQYASGATAGQAIFERGLHINKLESIGGAWRFGQRNHFNDYMTVTAVTLENGGLDTKVTFSTSDPSDSLQLDRTDVIMGRWNSSEALTTSNRQWVDPSQYQSVRVYGQTGSDDLGYVVAENTDWTDDIFVGDRVICCLWAHPDGFQIGRNTIASGFTGATCDNWLIQDYRVYQDHQPMLFHSSSTSILNCVFDNCSFEQHTPDGFYTLLAQLEGLPKQFAIKNTSMPTTVSLSVRNGAALFSQADMFLIDGCFLQQIGGDAGGETIENCFITNTVYKQAVNTNGMSFGTGNSILAADQYTLSNGRINKFGIPQTSVGTSTTEALPYTIAGTTRSATREIGAYSVGDTANDWVDYGIWESYSTLNTLVQGAADGATLDLTGRKFLFNGSEKVSVSNAKSIGISGGKFASGVIPSWTSIGSGVYEAGYTFGSGEGAIWIKPDGEIAAKLVAFPAVTRDKEFGASGSSDPDARHDYGLGNLDRFAILDSGGSSVGPNNASYDGGHLDTVFLGGTFGSAVQAAFDWNETASQIDDTRGCYLNVQASDNRAYVVPIKSVVGSATGVTFNVADGNDTVDSGGYVNVAVLGPVSAANLQAGQACLLPVDNKIRYKPRTSLGEVIIGSGTEPIFYLDISSYDYPDTIASPGTSQVYSFHGCEMVTGHSFIATTGGRKSPLCDIRNCTFNYTTETAVSRICGIVTECIFDQSMNASLYCGPNTEISKNYFGTTYKASNINASGVPDLSYGLAWNDPSGTHQGTGFPVTINRNFFSNPSSQHGQGASLYQGTCGNAIVTNNICMNMDRFLSMNFETPGDETAGIRTDMQPSQCIIKNNVIYESEYGNPQAPWSWNSLNVANVWDYATDGGTFFPDTTTPAGFTHEVSFNTHISTRGTASRINMYSGSSQFRIPTRMHHNYLQGVSVPINDSQFPTTSTAPKPIFRQRRNMFERRCLNYSNVISDDNYMLTNQESVARTSTDAPSFLSSSSLRVGSVLTTYGTDGSEIGARYTSGHPTLTNLRSINNNPSQTWWTNHVPVDVSTLPSENTVFTPDSATYHIDLGETEGTTISGWESFATAKSEITALSAGATIDFTGRKFSADYADQAGGGVNVVATNKSVQILGGQFSAGRTASWSSIGNGVYAADHNFGDYRSPLLYIQDDAVTGDILMRVDPLPPADADKYRFVNNKNWVVITASDGTNNGVVGTVGGSGASSPITGMQITDSTTKTTINNLIGGVTMDTSGADVKGPWAILHSANNVTAPVMITSWDNSTGMMGVTGFAGTTTIAYSGTYLKMTFCGLPGQTLSAGEYCLDFTEGITGGRVLYKPVSGDASDARIPVCDYVFSIGGAGSTFSIDGVTVEGTSARGSAPGAIIDNTDCNGLTVKNCNIRDHATGVRLNYVPATFDKNIMRRFTSRAMAVVAGTQLTNNILEHAEALSACLIQTEDNTDGVPYTLVQDNIFALESSTHGQGLSLYKNAWRNALVKHNIFYNCQRAHSFQNGGVGSDGNPREECYGYTFENNLVVVDKVLDIPGFLGGQKSISFNGGSDSIIESNGNQTAAIRSNTVVMTSNVPDTLSFASKLQLTSLDIHDLRHTSTVVENNIYSTANASLGSNVNGGHTHSNNVSTRINYVNATSTTDKLTHVNPDDVFEPNSFQAKVVAGGAHDNTRTGIRWTAIPTVAQIETIISNGDTNWASTYAGSTLPAQGSYSTAVHETREMGATFGGTGSFEIPWYSTAASYRTSSTPPPDGTTSGALGATGMAQTFSMWCYAPPSYASEFMLINFPSDEHKDKFYNAVSGDHAFSLSVTVVNGGSGAEFGQHAATAGHVFNYYWPVGQMTSYSSNATRLGLADASASSDPWPNAGITAHLWGQNPTINMQGATVSLDPSEQYTTITQNVTGYDGVQTSFEWTVNLEAVGSTGTFVDGSLWIVPAAGKTLRLYKTTPTNVTAHHGISSFGQQVGLTVYRNGVSINEKVGYEHGSLSDLISGSNTTVTGGFRTTDNRHSGIYGSPATIQDQLDELFDVTTFTSRQTILDAGTGGSGITLSTDDSVVLTRSYWDDTDDTDVGSWSNGIPLTGENTRTPIAQTAVLSVLSSAPVGDYFRPPIQWADGDRGNRPMYAASAFDHSNFGVTAGYGAHSASENPTPLGVSMDKLMNSPFLHTYGGIVYAASWPRESFAREDQGYGGAVMLGFGEALSEVYNTTITDEPDSAKLNLLYRFMQYGIDQFGVINRRPKISSGAGQKPAVSAPWMMLAASALGVTHGINSVVRTFVPGASALTDGSTSMAALKQQLFHEDYTLRQITTGTPDNWSSIGYTGAGNHLGTSGGHGYTLDLSNINGGVLADFDSNNVLEPKDGGAGNGIPYTFPLTTGVGRLDFTSTPMQSISSVAHNGATASVISAYPKGLYAGDYVGTKVGIKQTSGSAEEFYTLIMLSQDAGAYDVYDAATSSGACSFWLDRPLTAQPDSSSEIRIYPFGTEDNGGWTFLKEGAIRPDGEGGGAGATMGISRDASLSLTSTGYEKVSARAWIPVYMFLRNNYSKMGLGTSKIGEAINGYMGTILERTTSNDRRWQLMYGGDNVWSGYITAVTEAEAWISHSSITSDNKYYLPGTAPATAASGVPFYECSFTNANTSGQTDRIVSANHIESTGCTDLYNLERYNSRTMNSMGLGNSVVDHWVSHTKGGPFSLADYSTTSEFISAFNDMSGSGGTVDALLTADGITYPGVASASSVSGSVVQIRTTFLSGTSADEFKTRALGLSGSGATIGIRYSKNSITNTLSYSITHPAYGE